MNNKIFLFLGCLFLKDGLFNFKGCVLLIERTGRLSLKNVFLRLKERVLCF